MNIEEIKEMLEKFNKEVEKVELIRNPYSSKDKKFKHILISLAEEHFNMFKDTLNYITNLQKEYEDLKELEHDYRVELNLTARYEKRINKAIEYIENNDDEWFSTVELIGILKGEE